MAATHKRGRGQRGYLPGTQCILCVLGAWRDRHATIALRSPQSVIGSSYLYLCRSTTLCDAPRHSACLSTRPQRVDRRYISMLESSFRCGGSPPALHLEERRVVSNLGVGNSGPSCLGGEGGAVAEVPVYPPITQLHAAPQLHLDELLDIWLPGLPLHAVPR